MLRKVRAAGFLRGPVDGHMPLSFAYSQASFGADFASRGGSGGSVGVLDFLGFFGWFPVAGGESNSGHRGESAKPNHYATGEPLDEFGKGYQSVLGHVCLCF